MLLLTEPTKENEKAFGSKNRKLGLEGEWLVTVNTV
jgi:hypothetical protein